MSETVHRVTAINCCDIKAADDIRSGEVTQLLAELSSGNKEAEPRLLEVVYVELRRQAARYLRPERKDHSLQPTALVHEAYLRIAKPGQVAYQDRHHFFALAAQAMRRILVDHARAHRAEKRGGRQARITLDAACALAHQKTIDVLALDEALERLADLHPRQARVVELRFFGGLSIPEIAESLHVSEKTIKRDWEAARTWLFGALGNE